MSVLLPVLALVTTLAGGTQPGVVVPENLLVPPLQVQPIANDEAPESPTDDDVARARRWHLIAFPMLLYRADDGLGLGGVLSTGYRHDGEWPFSARLRLRASLTTRLVQRHEIRGELASRLVIPLSLRVSLGWFSTRSYNYCGVGNGVTCSDEVAEAAAAAARLDPIAADERVDKYYRVRFMEPYLDTLLRARLWDGALDVDVFGRVRSVYHLPGDAFSLTPYKGSLYARDFPDGERGVYIVPEVGMALDTRDVVALPTRGFYLEASTRGSATVWGSANDFGGVFATAAVWRPLGGPGRAVVGARVLADALVGDPPVTELGRTGGTDALTAFGGPWMGRGIRETRYIGKVKLVPQLELRTSVARFLLLRNEIDVGVAVFGDAAWIGADWDDLAGPGGDLARVLWSVGTGVRILINRDNVIRLDVALSPFEERGPQLYGYSGKTGVTP